MRTNIDIDDKLLSEAMAATGSATKKATVEAALQTVVDIQRRRQAIQNMRRMGWEGDLDEMREGWSSAPPR